MKKIFCAVALLAAFSFATVALARNRAAGYSVNDSLFTSSSVLPKASSSPPSKKLLAKARALYAEGDFGSAARVYKAIPAGAPEFAKSREEMAWAYLRAGDWGALEGTLAHLNSSLIPLEWRKEGRILSAINALHTCAYDKVQQEIHLFQNEMAPYARKIDAAIKSKKFSSLVQADRIHWENERAMVLEAITKMRFVKMELLSQLQRVEKFRAKRDILSETHQVASLDDKVALQALTSDTNKKWIYPADRDLWVDELFTLRSLPESQCEMLRGR